MLTAASGDVRQAAQRVANDWPSVTSADELTADLSLFLLDEGRLPTLLELPEYRRIKYLTDAALGLVLNEVAEFEYNTGNSLYSVGQVRYLLQSGGLINTRDRITATLPDLDEGCQYLQRVLPAYARVIYRRYAQGYSVIPVDVEPALRALTDCMNNINQGRKPRV